MNTNNNEYNGYANYETWNVALWIQNDEGLYNLARDYRHKISPYKRFIESLRELGENSPIAFQTPDGVSWNDSSLDVDALDEILADL